MKNLIISLSPLNITRRIVYVIKELYMFFFYVRTMSNIKQELKNNKIVKYSWFSYVKAVNIKAETLSLMNKPEHDLDENEKAELDKLELSFISREISKYNDIFISSGTIELIKTTAIRVKDNDFYRYMVEISFKWNNAKLYQILRLLFQVSIWIMLLSFLPYNSIYEYIVQFF